MEIGMKIYYELATGNVILNTGERTGSVVPTTREQDFESFRALKERVPETVGVIELEYGQHRQDFTTASGYRVNPETEELEFAFDPVEGGGEPVYQEPLTKRVATLETDNAGLTLELVQTQARLDKAEADSAALFLSLVEGGVI